MGKTIVEYKITDDTLYLKTRDGFLIKLYHKQDCCESVWIEDVEGELDDLLQRPLQVGEEVTEDGSDSDENHCTWTFYKFATSKGHVTIRWCGQSNGYYSESVDINIRRPGYPSGPQSIGRYIW